MDRNSQTPIAFARDQPAIQNLLLSIGAMKSATSWLYMQLRRHPRIAAVPLKEVHYFAHHHTGYGLLDFPDRLNRLRAAVEEMRADRPDATRAMLDWFRAYLADPLDDAWFGGLYRDPRGPGWCAEFSNLNALLPPSGWEHVRRAARRVRVIYTLRHPLLRLWSHTRFHLAFTGHQAELAHWDEAAFSHFLARPEIASHAQYALVLRTLDDNFDPAHYRVLLYDDIETQPLSVLAAIEALLEIEPGRYDTAKLAMRHNEGPPHPLPAAFIAAARPMVEAELEALDKQRFGAPAAWRMMSPASDPA